jgi:hypothetical protein
VALTRVTPNIIAVANNVTNKTVGNTTSIPSFTFDGSGVVTSASNVAISGAGITANTVANSAFQTGSVENYMNAQGTFAGMRNKIINGDMRISQRYAGSSVAVDDGRWYYPVDRIGCYGNASSSKFTGQQDSSANTVAGFGSSVKFTSSSSYTPSSSEYFAARQIIEGLNCTDLEFGTANAKPITVSFWARSSLTGSLGASVYNHDGSRSYPFLYTISTADTWEKKTITISGDTSGVWYSNNAPSITVAFSLGAGSTLKTTANAWASGYYPSATGATDIVGTSGATLYITGLQLEAGSTATPFEYRQYGTELQLCQRYYSSSGGVFGAPVNGVGYDSGKSILTTGSVVTDNSGYASFIQHPVAMRALPTITVINNSLSSSGNWAYYSRNGGWSSTGTNSIANQYNGFQLQFTISLAGRDAFIIQGCYTADAEM